MMFLSRFIVEGHSMEPTIFAKSTLLVSSIPYIFGEPKVGDVVVFKNYGKKLVKRIQKKEGRKYFIIGDNTNDSLDSRKIGWVKKEDILGKVIWILS